LQSKCTLSLMFHVVCMMLSVQVQLLEPDSGGAMQ